MAGKLLLKTKNMCGENHEHEHDHEHKKIKCNCGTAAGGCGGAVYGLGLIGAAVYYIQNAVGFWDGFVGFLKALVWPAFLVYQLFEFLAK